MMRTLEAEDARQKLTASKDFDAENSTKAWMRVGARVIRCVCIYRYSLHKLFVHVLPRAIRESLCVLIWLFLVGVDLFLIYVGLQSSDPLSS